jgi:hypothetical protein
VQEERKKKRQAKENTQKDIIYKYINEVYIRDSIQMMGEREVQRKKGAERERERGLSTSIIVDQQSDLHGW